MAERGKGNGQQSADLIVMLHTEVLGILTALDRQEQRSDRFEGELGRFEEQLQRFREETKRNFGEQKQLYGELKDHVRRMAEIILGVGDHLSDHERRLAAIEAKIF